MKLRLLAIFLIAALGAATLAAADSFWEKKKYNEWTEKEVQKLVRDSPWARSHEVRFGNPTMPSGSGGGGGRGGRRGGGGGMPSMDASEGFGSERGGSGAGGGAEGAQSPSASIIIRWHTALPIKQAVARARYGDEVEKSADAQKILGREENRYIVGLIGLPMQVMRGNPAELKEKIVLRIKGQPPIQVENIQPERAENRVNLYLFFPKGQNGGHVITLEDNEVELFVPIGNVEIKRKFRLKEMVFGGKLEI